MLVETWRQLGANYDFLRFHSITEEELMIHDITHPQLAYLVVLFETAEYYYEHVDVTEGPFHENSLRYQILQSEATGKAWPLVRRFFLHSGNYVRKVEATIALYK